MFKLFEKQPNWTLKQLVQKTDQPEVLLLAFRSLYEIWFCFMWQLVSISSRFHSDVTSGTLYGFDVSLSTCVAAISERYAEASLCIQQQGRESRNV